MESDTTEDIMGAVYGALCTHGYADLTMQDIADESSLSKGALHYHYDTKRELLRAFLEHLYERFAERLSTAEAEAGDDPAERLFALVETAMVPPEKDDLREFRTAVLEIKAQAPYEPTFRETLAAFDASVEERVAAVVAEGVESGRFDEDVDPAEVASFVVTVINGAHTRSVATDYNVEGTRRALLDYVEELLADGEEVESR